MSLLAFMPAVAKSEAAQVETKPALPMFKRRWWYTANRVDARPVMWSLWHRPTEWERTGYGIFFRLRHKPSNHVFGGEYLFDCGLDSSGGCGCGSERQFQIGQRARFSLTAHIWALRNPIVPPGDPSTLHAKFASHFVR